MGAIVLSRIDQGEILDLADKSAKASRSKMRNGLLFAAGMLALGLLVPVLPVPAAVTAIATVAGVMAGGFAAGNALNIHEMNKVKRDGRGIGFSDTLEARTEKRKALNENSKHFAAGSLFATGLLTVAAALYPPTAPLFIGLRVLTILGFLGGVMTRAVTERSAEELHELARDTNRRREYKKDHEVSEFVEHGQSFVSRLQPAAVGFNRNSTPAAPPNDKAKAPAKTAGFAL